MSRWTGLDWVALLCFADLSWCLLPACLPTYPPTHLHERGGAVDEGLGVHGLVLHQEGLGDLDVDVRLLRVGDRPGVGCGVGGSMPRVVYK